MYRPKLKTRLGLVVPSTLGEVESRYDRHLELENFDQRELSRRKSMQQLQNSVVAVSSGVSEAKRRREAITSALSQRDLLPTPAQLRRGASSRTDHSSVHSSGGTGTASPMRTGANMRRLGSKHSFSPSKSPFMSATKTSNKLTAGDALLDQFQQTNLLHNEGGEALDRGEGPVFVGSGTSVVAVPGLVQLQARPQTGSAVPGTVQWDVNAGMKQVASHRNMDVPSTPSPRMQKNGSMYRPRHQSKSTPRTPSFAVPRRQPKRLGSVLGSLERRVNRESKQIEQEHAKMTRN